MIKNIILVLVFFVFCVRGASYKAEILCDPVRQINSFVLSKEAVVNRAFHEISGEPAQCLRLSIAADTERTSMFARITARGLVKKKIKFICAVAPAFDLAQKSFSCKIVANGKIVFNERIDTNQIHFILDEPAINNSGNVDFSFEISYDGLENITPVDIILPALFEIEKYDAGVSEPDILLGESAGKKTWRFCGKESESFKQIDKIYFTYKIEFEKIISQSIFPQAGAPVELAAVLKNTGWQDYYSSEANAVKIKIDEKTAKMGDEAHTRMIPDIPAGQIGKVSWTVHPHKNIASIKGELISNFLDKKVNFTVPTYTKNKYKSKTGNDDVWERLVSKKDNFIAFDWRKAGVRLRFVQSPKGIENIQFAVKNKNEYETISIANQFAVIDVLLPNNEIKRMVFKPRSVKFVKGEPSKVMARGWIFSKETGGLVIEQEYKRSDKTAKICISTKILAKKDISIARIYQPNFQVDLDEKSVIIAPGFLYEKALAQNKHKKYRWIFYDSFGALFPLNRQLVPFVIAKNAAGIFALEKNESVFTSENSAWFIDKNGGRLLLSNIAVPSNGSVYQKVKSNGTITVKTVVEVLPKNTKLYSAMPDVLQLGVTPSHLIAAEKVRLVKNFVKPFIAANSFSNEEIAAQFVLIEKSRKEIRSADTIGKISKLYSELRARTNGFIPITSKYSFLYGINFSANKTLLRSAAEKISLALCTKYDWALDNKISGKMILDKLNVKTLSDDILILIKSIEFSNDESARKIVETLLKKIRGVDFIDAKNNTLLIFAKIAKANVAAYKFTKNKSYLEEAKRLLKLCEVFMNKSSKNISRDIGMAINFLGNSSPEKPLAGMLSQEATLAFADALYDLAKADNSTAGRNNRVANLLIEAVEQYYLRGNIEGMIPEYWSPDYRITAGGNELPFYLWKMFLRQNAKE